MLSVVIPTLNRPDSLIKLVDSIQLQNMPNESYEIIVVYNTKTDFNTSPFKNRPQIQTLCAPHPGVNHARNHGALHAKGDVILFLDDDCEATNRQFLNDHCVAHQLHPELVAIGGPYQLSSRASLFDQIYQQNNLNWTQANQSAECRSTALLGGNTSYKAFVFRKGYRFTEEILYGGSETPLNTILALQYGAHGYFPHLTLQHNTQLTLRTLLQKAYLQGKGAALQTKFYGHQLKQVSAGHTNAPILMFLGLELYALFFNIGYQAQLSNKNIFLIFCKTIIYRYFAQFLSSIYWWLHANVRHPIITYPNKIYWFCYSLFTKSVSMAGQWSVSLYWKIYPHGTTLQGFVRTLFEPLPHSASSSVLFRLQSRFSHIAKKFGWLLFKTVGLR